MRRAAKVIAKQQASARHHVTDETIRLLQKTWEEKVRFASVITWKKTIIHVFSRGCQVTPATGVESWRDMAAILKSDHEAWIRGHAKMKR